MDCVEYAVSQLNIAFQSDCARGWLSVFVNRQKGECRGNAEKRKLKNAESVCNEIHVTEKRLGKKYGKRARKDSKKQNRACRAALFFAKNEK